MTDVKYINKQKIMLIRVETGRDGFETCSAANVGHRIYVAKEKGSSYEDNKENVQNFAIKLREEYNRIGLKKKLDRCDPLRMIIYWNDEDMFFSYIFAFKLTASEISKFAKINELRFLLARNVTLQAKYDKTKEHFFYVVFVNSSDIQKATAGFDASHCEEAPVKDLEGKELRSYFEKATAKDKKAKASNKEDKAEEVKVKAKKGKAADEDDSDVEDDLDAEGKAADEGGTK